MIRSYCKAFFSKPNSKVRLASARAGNVMGGGDWAVNRIVPDCMRSWSKNKKVTLRSPKSTRPWQHVLEITMCGYLTLIAKLNLNKKLIGESFNFGPKANNSYSVEELVSKLSSHLEYAEYVIKTQKEKKYEAKLLNLNISKASRILNWKPILTFNTTAKWTAEWYDSYYKKSKLDGYKHSLKQIQDYEKLLKMLDKLQISDLKIITMENGNLYHGLKKSDQDFDKFGEIYFITVNQNKIKAWKMHTKNENEFDSPKWRDSFQFHRY